MLSKESVLVLEGLRCVRSVQKTVVVPLEGVNNFVFLLTKIQSNSGNVKKMVNDRNEKSMYKNIFRIFLFGITPYFI